MFIHALLALALTSSAVAPVRSPANDSIASARRHTSLGIAIAPVSDALRRMDYLLPGEGVTVAQVQPGSAAEAAHLRVGDVILGIDGKRVDETTLFSTVRDIPRGQTFQVEYLRDNGWHSVAVKIDP